MSKENLRISEQIYNHELLNKYLILLMHLLVLLTTSKYDTAIIPVVNIYFIVQINIYCTIIFSLKTYAICMFEKKFNSTFMFQTFLITKKIIKIYFVFRTFDKCEISI